MKDYKRVTKKADVIIGGCEYSCPCLHIDLVQRLGELEDKIENGTLIELPCKVGTMVYYIASLTVSRLFQRSIVYDIVELPFNLDMLDTYKNCWFVDKSEAEAKLKELKGEV